jgi:hypothetical protein
MCTSALNAVKQRLVERFGAVATLPESEGVCVHWKTQKGVDSILTALVTDKGNLRVEFTRNLADGITEPTDKTGTVFIRLHTKAKIMLWNDTLIPVMYGTWNMTKGNHTVEHLIDMIDTLTRDV